MFTQKGLCYIFWIYCCNRVVETKEYIYSGKERSMSNYFKSEFRRAFLSKNTLIALAVIFFMFIIGFISEMDILGMGNNIETDGLDMFISVLFSSRYSWLFMIAPIIASIPFATSFIEDRESETLKVICTKMKVKDYFKIKAKINGIIGGLVFVIPEIIMLIFFVLIYGISSDKMLNFLPEYQPIYHMSKILYIGLIIFFHFIYGIVLSTLSLGISTITKNKYLTLLIPFVYLIISGTLFPMIGLVTDGFSLHLGRVFILKTFTTGQYSMLNILMNKILIFAVGLGLLYFGGVKRTYEEI